MALSDRSCVLNNIWLCCQKQLSILTEEQLTITQSMQSILARISAFQTLPNSDQQISKANFSCFDSSQQGVWELSSSSLSAIFTKTFLPKATWSHDTVLPPLTPLPASPKQWKKKNRLPWEKGAPFLCSSFANKLRKGLLRLFPQNWPECSVYYFYKIQIKVVIDFVLGTWPSYISLDRRDIKRRQ